MQSKFVGKMLLSDTVYMYYALYTTERLKRFKNITNVCPNIAVKMDYFHHKRSKSTILLSYLVTSFCRCFVSISVLRYHIHVIRSTSIRQADKHPFLLFLLLELSSLLEAKCFFQTFMHIQRCLWYPFY